MHVLTRTCVCVCAHARAHSCPTLCDPKTVTCRLPCPWFFPGKNTAVGCRSLLRGPSWPRGGTCVSCVSCIAGRVCHHQVVGEAWCIIHVTYKACISYVITKTTGQLEAISSEVWGEIKVICSFSIVRESGSLILDFSRANSINKSSKGNPGSKESMIQMIKR